MYGRNILIDGWMDKWMEYFNERMSAKLELNQEHVNQYLRIS